MTTIDDVYSECLRHLKRRANNVHRLDEYKSIYNLLCLNAHNNIRSLETDQVEHTADGAYQMTLYAQGMTMSAIKGVLLAIGVLAAGIDNTHKLLGTADERARGVLDSWVAERRPIEAVVMKSEQERTANQAVVATSLRAAPRR